MTTSMEGRLNERITEMIFDRNVFEEDSDFLIKWPLKSGVTISEDDNYSYSGLMEAFWAGNDLVIEGSSGGRALVDFTPTFTTVDVTMIAADLPSLARLVLVDGVWTDIITLNILDEAEFERDEEFTIIVDNFNTVSPIGVRRLQGTILNEDMPSLFENDDFHYRNGKKFVEPDGDVRNIIHEYFDTSQNVYSEEILYHDSGDAIHPGSLDAVLDSILADKDVDAASGRASNLSMNDAYNSEFTFDSNMLLTSLSVDDFFATNMNLQSLPTVTEMPF